MITAHSYRKNIDSWRKHHATKHGLDKTTDCGIESDDDIKDWCAYMNKQEGVVITSNADGRLTTQQYTAGIDELDEIVDKYSKAVWASFTPLFEVGTNAGKEKKVEESFALYLKFIDRGLAGRKKQITRITWRHWYSGEKNEYGYLHFHILYLLDDTGLTTDHMIAIHEQALEKLEELDKTTLEDVREALTEKELQTWAAKAGHKYQVQKRESRSVVNRSKSIAVRSHNNRECVGYGSKMMKQKRDADAGVYELYSTTPHHTVLNKNR